MLTVVNQPLGAVAGRPTRARKDAILGGRRFADVRAAQCAYNPPGNIDGRGNPMKVETGIPIDDLRKVPAAAQEAEALGFDGVVTPETQHDPFFPLLVAAEHTQKLGIAST